LKPPKFEFSRFLLSFPLDFDLFKGFFLPLLLRDLWDLPSSVGSISALISVLPRLAIGGRNSLASDGLVTPFFFFFLPLDLADSSASAIAKKSSSSPPSKNNSFASGSTLTSSS
jgi:hypothetical protein